MRKHLFIVLLSVVYLSTTTEFKQFFKLPILFAHYLEHNGTFNDLNFLDYIFIHYSEEFIYDGDSERDMELPFKSSTHTSSVFFSATTPKFESHLIHIIEIESTERVTITNQSETLKGYFGRIWNPPKEELNT
jgi:hypothetical protein